MSGRLDQSLDTIIDSQKKAKRDQQRRRKSTNNKGAAATAAPVGGVKKSTKPARPAIKAPAAGPASRSRDSKIVVSGLVGLQISTSH